MKLEMVEVDVDFIVIVNMKVIQLIPSFHQKHKDYQRRTTTHVRECPTHLTAVVAIGNQHEVWVDALNNTRPSP